jgi:predicted DNA-binding transcriptional regulator AlpA
MSEPTPLRFLNRQARRRRRRRVSILAVDAKRLARMLCCGVRTIRSWDAAGRLPSPIRIGGRVVWRLDEIRAWLRAGAPNRSEWNAIYANKTKTRGG